MAGIVCANEVLVQEPWVRSQDGVQFRLGHHRSRRRDLQHPEHCDGRRKLVGFANRCGKGKKGRGHSLDRRVERRRLVQVDPCDAQMRGVWKPIGWRLAALEVSCQLDIVTAQHIITISYYSFSVNYGIPAEYPGRVDRGARRSTNL